MKTVRLIVDFTYDDEIMYSDQEGEDWFLDLLMDKDDLHLHSNEIGDFIGDVNVIFFLEDELEVQEEDFIESLVDEPCRACGKVPAQGVYHNVWPCCIECYYNGNMRDVLSAEAS